MTMNDDTRPVTIQIPRPRANGACAADCPLNQTDRDGDSVGCGWSLSLPGYFYLMQPGPGCPWYESKEDAE
jgi:hypothetical protein